MNSEEFGGIARAVLAALGGVAVTKGWVDNATMLSITGALATVLVGVWSVIAKRRAPK